MTHQGASSIKAPNFDPAFKCVALSVVLASTAKTDLGAFLSLQSLSPIVLSTGSNAAATAVLQTAHPSQWADWNADKNARLYGDTSKQPTYSDNWYTDRAAMLQELVTRNEKDIGGIVPGSQNLLYQDVASSTEVLVGAGAAIGQRTIVRFGSAGAEPLEGGAFDDHLYGGAGDDTLNGLGKLTFGTTTLGIGKAGGQLNLWVAKAGQTEFELRVLDDSTSATGKRLLCRKNEQKRPLTHGNISFVAMNLKKLSIATCKVRRVGQEVTWS